MLACATLVPAAGEVVRRTKVRTLWKMGLGGEGVRVAVVDTGIDPGAIDGHVPIFEHDFTGENNVGDRQQHHGTLVANCIRLIAPHCELLNAKVVPHHGATSKKRVADALKQLSKQDVDIVNISLDFDADGCNPTFRDELGSWHGALLISKKADRSTMCELCLACWDLAESGIVVVAAAGNRWGKRTMCPGRSPGSLCVEATSPKGEWDYFYTSRSRLRRWWDWKFMGRVGRQFGTSFASGYTSGEMALLMPWIRQLGWIEARKRIGSIPRRGTTTAIQLHDSLVFDSAESRQVNNALKLAKQEGRIAGQLQALDELRKVEPKFVHSGCRENVSSYLSFLSEAVANMESSVQKMFERMGMEEVLECWGNEQE